jgi:hypothetical protein
MAKTVANFIWISELCCVCMCIVFRWSVEEIDESERGRGLLMD